jgi:hypothetical protein
MPQFLTRWIVNVLQIPFRQRQVVGWYLITLMMEARRHSMTLASEISGLHRAQFSRLLSEHKELAETSLLILSTNIGLALSKAREILVPKTSWTIAIIVDATLHKRSSRHVQNAQRLNHGKGYVVGHQWTNVVLVINGKLIPLRPIAFITKKACKNWGIEYKSEHVRVIEYLEKLELAPYIGKHSPHEVVVLMDSGYDDAAIQKTVHGRGWDLVSALKANRNVKTTVQWDNREKGWHRVDDLFRSVRKQAPWKALWIEGETGRKRSRFRARRIEGRMKELPFKVVLVCSENSNQGRKHLVCTNPSIDTKAIIHAYKIRWEIELFHRAVKNNFGLQDAGVKDFDSLVSHVHWVYCAYLLSSKQDIGQKKGIEERQRALRKWLEEKPLRKIKQVCSRIGDAMDVRRQCYAVIEAAGM